MNRFAPITIMLAVSAFVSAGLSAQDTKELPELEEAVVDQNPRFAAFQKIQNYMNTVNSLKANFTQRSPGGLVAEGKLYLERPGRIRFDYSDETPILVVSDGKTLNLVDEEIEQVTKWPVKDTPLRVLLGNAVDLATYGARVEVAPGGIDDIVALHAVDPERTELGTITVYFRENGTGALSLVSWAVIDAQGETTVVELSSAETNVKLAKSLWTFEDPRGLLKRRRGIR